MARTMTCNRRTVLAAMAGGTALGTVGSFQASAIGQSHLVTGADGILESVPAFGEQHPATLEGTVRTPPTTTDSSLLVGTNRGLYVFENGAIDGGAPPEESLASFVPTRPIRRIRPVGDEQAVVLVEDEHFPNILLVDLTDGEIEWTAYRTESVFSQTLGQVDRQVGAYDAVVLDDGSENVAVATGYGISVLDRQTGETQWALEWEYYVWQVTAEGDFVYATTQDGTVLGVDAATGEIRFETEVAEPFDGIRRSAWEITLAAGELVVTTEDGFVAAVDPVDGSIRWETSVLELDDSDLESYYRRIDGRPTLAGRPGRSPDENFFNLELTPVGEDGFLIRTHELDGPPGAGELVFVEAGGGVRWREDTIDLEGVGNTYFSADTEADHVLVPSSPRDRTIEIRKLDRTTGAVTETLELPTETDPRRGGRTGEVGYTGAVGGKIVLGSARGDLSVLDGGDRHWNFPSIRDSSVLQADFLGDGTDDILIASQNRGDRPDETYTRSLVVRSGTDGSIEWSQTLDVDQFRESGGLQDITLLDRDGNGSDLLAFQYPPQREIDDEIRDLEREVENLEREIRNLERNISQLEREPRDHEAEIEALEAQIADLESEIASVFEEIEELGGRRVGHVVSIAGDDGDVQWAFPLEFGDDQPLPEVDEPLSVDTLGAADQFILVGLRGRILVIEERPTEFRYWWHGYSDGSDLWPPLDGHQILYRTVDGPGTAQRVVAVAPHESTVAILDVTVGSTVDHVDFSKLAEVELDGDRIRQDSFDTIGDLNGDGYEEFVCRVEDDDGIATVVVSPEDGSVLQRFESQDRVMPTLQPTVSPTGGERGLVTFTGGEDRFTIQVHDGTDEMWRERWDMDHPDLFERTIQPAALAGDIDGDGTEELAVARYARLGGAKVDFYNLATGERVHSLTLSSFDEDVDPDEDDLNPATLVRRIPDQTGNGHPEVAIITETTGEDDERTFFVIDPTEPDVLVSGEAADGVFVTLEESLGLVGRDASLLPVDAGAGVTIQDPGEESPVELSWEFDDEVERVSTVSVHDRPVAITTDQSATLELPAGDHGIDLAATSPSGITVHDSIRVDIDDSSVMDLVLYAAASLSVVALFGISLIDQLRRRAAS